jgi:hypothetical protein
LIVSSGLSAQPPRCRISGSVFPAETMIRRDMDFLLVAVELTVPVRSSSLEVQAGERKAVRVLPVFDAGNRESWMNELDAPESGDES